MATPFLVQRKSDASINPTATANWKVNLLQPSPGGNCIVVYILWGDATATASVTDDKSNTYTSTTLITDGGNNTRLQVFFALNVTAGTQQVRVAISVAASFNQVMVEEWGNVATVSALDGQSGGTATGTSLASGSYTTTANGDLILDVVMLD